MKSRSIALLIIVLCTAGPAHAEVFRWPLNEPRKLSSSFGEYRDGHYHAGVDLRTFGRIGLPCLAPDSCEVVRLRVSPIGYGKALYVRLRDGRTAVYAHLNGFSRELDSLSYHWRLERGKNSCDFEIGGGRVRFAPGEAVAYTGATGSPHPHLHFEIRDTAGRPINPLVDLYEVPDACPPIISALEVVPLSWGSLVNGSPVPLTKRFRLLKDARFVLDDTLRLDGSAGFGVSMYDKQVRGSYRMAPYSVEFLIDGETVYRVRNRMFDYSSFGDIALEYEDRGGSAPGRYFTLYRKSGNAMPDREGSGIITNDAGRAGAVVLTSGLHRGEIVVRDAAGNEVRGMFRFIFQRRPEIEAERRVSFGMPRVEIDAFDPDGGAVSTNLTVSTDGGTTWSFVALEESSGALGAAAAPDPGALYRCVARDGEGAMTERFFAFPDPRTERDSVLCDAVPELRAEGLYLKIRTDRALASIPSVRRSGEPRGDSLGVLQLGHREYIAFTPVARLSSGVNVFTIRGRDHRGYPLERVCVFQIFTFGAGSFASFDSGDGLMIRLKAPSVRGMAALMVSEAPDPGRKAPGLEPVTVPFSLDFPIEGYARPLQCGFDSGRAAGLYRWNGKVGWRCVGVPEREGGMVDVKRPGVYAIFIDANAPVLKRLAFTRRTAGSGFFKRKLYYVPVYDGGSGVDAESATAILNGARVVCEYDEYRSRVAIPIPASYPAGHARLRVEVSDRSGNRNAAEFSFMIE
ncbi:MAG: hypothetical protein WC674_11280 [Candidatus Krumholzibacteriia bacterium]